MIRIAALTATLALTSLPAIAQEDYTAAYSAIMQRMHADMAMAPTGDADLDFARGMIPHHQGAVDMAELLLAHGADPELRKLAEAVIETQTAEIAFLEAWIAAHEAGN